MYNIKNADYLNRIKFLMFNHVFTKILIMIGEEYEYYRNFN